MINKQKSAKTQPKSNGLRKPGRDFRRNRAQPRCRPSRVLSRSFTGPFRTSTSVPRGASRGFCSIRTVRPCRSTSLPTWVSRWSGELARTWKPRSSRIRTPQARQGRSPVYRLVSLTGTDGKALIFSGPATRETVTVQGVVKRINYARHGAANGVILESGDFVHLKPAGHEARGSEGGRPGDRGRNGRADAAGPAGDRSQDRQRRRDDVEETCPVREPRRGNRSPAHLSGFRARSLQLDR